MVEFAYPYIQDEDDHEPNHTERHPFQAWPQEGAV
jgi:hypothetical protein